MQLALANSQSDAPQVPVAAIPPLQPYLPAVSAPLLLVLVGSKSSSAG